MNTYSLIGFAILLYFLPTILTSSNQRNATSVFVMNLLLGWTLIGWFYALIGALSKQTFYR